MKIDPDAPYFSLNVDGLGHATGISIRAQFAMVAMQGMLANPDCGSLSATTESAARFADALIAKLNEEAP